MSMRLPYSYLVLRYVHDVIRGEFANVGVVLFAPDSQFLRGRFVSDFGRLRAMFGEIDEAHLSAMVQHLDHVFAMYEPAPDDRRREISQLARQALPADDSSLQWSPAGGGVTGDLTDTLNHLFERFVHQPCEPATA